MEYKVLTAKNGSSVFVNMNQMLFMESVPDAMLGQNVTNLVFVGGIAQVKETPQEILGILELSATPGGE